MHAEVAATQMMQRAMQALGGHIVLVAVISQASHHVGEDFMLKPATVRSREVCTYLAGQEGSSNRHARLPFCGILAVLLQA